MIEIKFGTAVPVSFREIDKSTGLDMEIHARLNGVAAVEDYDKTLYDSEEKVREAIRSNINTIITRCLNDRWDKDISVLSGWVSLLGPLMDQEFDAIGITARTSINSMVVLPEDEEKMKEFRKENNLEPVFSSLDMTYVSAFDKAIKENAKRINWRCSMCGTQNTGGMCSYCGAQKPLFW